VSDDGGNTGKGEEDVVKSVDLKDQCFFCQKNQRSQFVGKVKRVLLLVARENLRKNKKRRL